MPNVTINGVIIPNDDQWIYDWFGIENTCPNNVRKALDAAAGQDITVEINSGGGDVFSGNEIYYLLYSYRGKKTVDITGLAASAATIIACAGTIVRATPGAQYMIHNVSSGAQGDYHTMDKTSEILQNANKSITNIYQLKTGMSQEELLKLMDQESWFDAVRAKELGFIDEIIGDNGKLSKPFTINNSFANLLSEEVKEKIRNTIKNPNQYSTSSDFLLHKEQLNLLRMRGKKHEI